MWSVIPQSNNTTLLRFVFDNPHAAAGMEVASYLLTRAFIGKEKEDGTRGVVVRPYTPSHTTIGYLELVVKVTLKSATEINRLAGCSRTRLGRAAWAVHRRQPCLSPYLYE